MTLKQFIPKAVIFSCLSNASFGLEIDGFTQQTNERFKDSASFVGTGMDLSGIGRDNSGRWATLISPSIFISANHFAPSGTVSFYEDNNPAKTAVKRNVVSGSRIGNSDLYIGNLDAPVSPNITHYNFATSTAGLSSSTIAYQVGNPDVNKTLDSGFPNTLNMVMGLNKLDSFRNRTHSGSTSDSFWTAQESITHYNGRHVNYEALVQNGDSGSPLFVTDNSKQITIIGTGWFKGNLFSLSGSRPASVYTFTGSHTREIDAYIAQHVPEQGTSVLLGISFLFITFRRKK